jgi:NDP-sugar pyrophosphorylase family protein
LLAAAIGGLRIDMQDIIVLGAGGNCIDICEAVLEISRRGAQPSYRLLGLLDDNAPAGSDVAGYPVLGPLADAPRFRSAHFVNGIGSPQSFPRKPQIIEKTGMPLERFETIVHPSARVSPSARVGRGVVILQNAVIASRARLGDHVMVLPVSVVSHDDVIGDYTCLAGGVVVSGAVVVGRSC